MGATFSSLEEPVLDKYYDAFVKDMASQHGKTFAVTGTTSGTGFQAAKALASRGATVFCLNRPSERATSSIATLRDFCGEGGSVEQVDCDLQDFASVRGAAEALITKTSATGLHGLLNNAGVMALAAKATKDSYEIQMQTNHLSHFLLTCLLLPSLDKAAGSSGEARVVNHSSSARNMPHSPIEAKYMQPFTDGVDLGNDGNQGRGKRYQQSKLANCVFTMALKEKLQAKGSLVKALVAHPGVSSTALGSNASSHSPGSFLDNKMAMRVLKNFLQGQGDGCLPMLSAAVAPEAASGDFYVPANIGVLGRVFGEQMTGPPVKLDWVARGGKEQYVKAPEGQKTLWECSEAATGVTFLA